MLPGSSEHEVRMWLSPAASAKGFRLVGPDHVGNRPRRATRRAGSVCLRNCSGLCRAQAGWGRAIRHADLESSREDLSVQKDEDKFDPQIGSNHLDQLRMACHIAPKLTLGPRRLRIACDRRLFSKTSCSSTENSTPGTFRRQSITWPCHLAARGRPTLSPKNAEEDMT